MKHSIHRVTHFFIVAPYTLALEFEDRSQQVIDFEPVLYGQLFGPLRDIALFEKVELDPEVGTIQWPNGADFDPETLHNWPRYRDELIAMAEGWASRDSDPGTGKRI